LLNQTPIEIKALASPALLERGCVNVIGLEAIKENAGARWPRICSTVYGRLEALLRQRLGPSDFFARIDDATYLVTMPSSEPEDVNIVCMRVAYELCSNLLGQFDLNQIRISKAVNAGDNQMSMKPLPTERLATLAEKAGINDLSATDGSAQSGKPDAFANSSQNIKIIEGETASTKALSIVYQFVPVWSAANNAITTYICEPRQVMTLDAPHHHILTAQLTEKERIKIEIATLREGIRHLVSHIESGNRFILGVKISFDVLGSPAGRMEYLTECRGMSYEFRQYLDFIITNVPHGIAHTRLNDLSNTLRPFGRSISATVAPGTLNFAPYQGTGLRSIGYNELEFTHDRVLSKDNVLCLAQAAKAAKTAAFVLGIRRLTTLQMAHDAGAQILSGSAISPAMPEPKGMMRLTWDDIMSSHELLSA
jgi:hypothetical protein